MDIQNEARKYLSGEKLHSGFMFKISNKETSIFLRAEYIGRIIENKNVLHIGCADHIPLIKEKMEKNIWFHKELLDRANVCIGIDIDGEAIAYLNALGFDNVFHSDVTKDDIPESVKTGKWDYMVLGEILEHLDNPVDFLNAIASKYGKFVERFIVTVPNAFRMRNFRLCLRHFEFINSDHRYWFTPYTLAKVMTRSNMIVEKFDFVQSYPLSSSAFVSRYLLKKFPPLRDAIVMISRIDSVP